MNLRSMLVGGVLCLAVGCGGGSTGDNPVPVVPKESPVKVMIEDIAKTGELGSAGMDIRNALEGHPKKDELLKDLMDMEKGGTPDQIKKKAAAMAAKL
jgi:predicted transcriptional regulator